MIRKGIWRGDVVLEEDRNHFVRISGKKWRDLRQNIIQRPLMQCHNKKVKIKNRELDAIKSR